MTFPSQGTPAAELLNEMRSLKDGDADWRGGKTWSLIYHAGEDVDRVAADAHALFLFENALNPRAFPSLARFEKGVVDMAGSLLHAPDGFRGAMTSGGSETILMSVKTARDKTAAGAPQMVVPISAHPAFDKAAHFLRIEMVHTPLRHDLRADVDAMAAAITDRTVLVVGSAPGYPHGVIDPIDEIGALAAERGIPMHVDACLGGFLLPFYEKLGEAVPPFDFRVPGVTSMSADVHKYGYAPKGASVLVHRDREHARHQPYGYDGWPGGLYGTRGVQGARGGGPIAAAYAVMRYLGEDGYLRLARVIRDTARKLIDGVNGIEGLRVLGKPDMSVFSFVSDDADVFAIGDVMDDKGWRLDRQQLPDSLHLMVTPNHAKVADQFLSDLRESAGTAGERRTSDASYT